MLSRKGITSPVGLAEKLLSFIRLVPAPGVSTGSAFKNPFPVHVGYHIRVPGKQGFGCTHGGTKGDLALSNPVLTVEFFLFVAEILLWSAGTEGTFVHGTACTEYLTAWKLRRTEGAGHETIATADTGVLADEYYTVIALVNGVHRTDCNTGCICTVHAGNRDGFLAWPALVYSNYPAAVDPHRYVVALLAGYHTAATVNTTFYVT